jgi:type IV pilus assembly protein PilM
MTESQFFKKIAQGLMTPVKFQGGDFLENMLEKGVRVVVDIGSSSIKIIEVQATSNGPLVRTVAYREFPRSLDSKGSMPAQALIEQTLVDLWRSHKIRPGDVRLIISDPAVYLRYLTIPRIEEQELQKALRWQIEKYVPFAIEEASIDYQIVDHEGLKDKTQMRIIVVAVERKVIDKYLGILKAVKVVPTVIDIAAFSAAKAVMKMSPANSQQTVLVVDIGAHTISMVVFKARVLLMVRSIENAGDQMTRMISETCTVDIMTAEDLKRQAVLFFDEKSASSHNKVLAVMQTICQQWAQEIDRSLTYCEREGLAETIDKIILCGGSAKLKGLDQFVASQLGLPVEVVNVAKHIPCEQLDAQGLATEFLAAYGGLF